MISRPSAHRREAASESTTTGSYRLRLRFVWVKEFRDLVAHQVELHGEGPDRLFMVEAVRVPERPSRTKESPFLRDVSLRPFLPPPDRNDVFAHGGGTMEPETE
jgi:hypothetical protein